MSHRSKSMPWWREPMVWLVIGGPAAVVVAAVVTAAIALHSPDPVIKTDAAHVPAVQARNHAATPPAQPAPLPRRAEPAATPPGAKP